MKIKGPLLDGILVARPNRFLAVVDLDGKEVKCFCPNPGRMYELMVPGKSVIVRMMDRKNAKTDHDLIVVRHAGEMVSIDSRFPNALVKEALEEGTLPEFSGYKHIRPEYTWGKSRFDFLLDDGESCLLEVKSCTLVEGGVARFPDAPTERGARHVTELAQAKKEGYRAAVLFIIQRTDATVWRPNDGTDPKFGEALRKAAASGVEVYAYCAEFKGREIKLRHKVDINLDG